MKFSFSLKITTLVGISSLLICSQSFADTRWQNFAFIKVEDKTKKENVEIINQIQEDFNLVEAGKKPKFAKFEEGQPLLSDGGTTIYRGKGYTITIQQTLGQLMGVSGYFYGPIIKLDNQQLGDSKQPISSIKFYSANEFKTFKK